MLRDWKISQKAAGKKGTITAFADHYGLDRSHTSQMKMRVREIGDEIARRLEENHKPRLPHGWLDELHKESDPKGAYEEAISMLAVTLYRQNPVQTSKLLADFKQSIAKKPLARKGSKLTDGKRSANL